MPFHRRWNLLFTRYLTIAVDTMHDDFAKTTQTLTDLNLSVQNHNIHFTTKLLRILTRCLQSTQMTTFTRLLDSLRVTNHFILQKYKCILSAQCRTLSLYNSIIKDDRIRTCNTLISSRLLYH